MIMEKKSGRINQYLPEDLITDIQQRLTVPGLGRLSCVSKSWNSTLSNPIFVYRSLFSGQNEEQEEDPSAQIIIAVPTDYHTRNSEPLQYLYTCLPYDSLLDNNNKDSIFREFPNPEPDKVVCCEGGLICLRYEGDFGLFNPATCETKMLPPLPQDQFDSLGCKIYKIIKIGFIMMETEEEDQYYRYKVVRVSRNHEKQQCVYRAYVFSSDDESSGWRGLQLPSRLTAILSSPSSSLGDEIPQRMRKKKKCYWIAFKPKAASLNLVSFDPATEAFHVGESLSFSYRVHSVKDWEYPSAYMVKEDTVIVLFHISREVWMLKQELDVAKSWCKLFTIPALPEITRSAWMIPRGLWKHGKVICEEMENRTLHVLDVTTTPPKISALQLIPENQFCNHYEDVMIYTPSRKSLASRQARNPEMKSLEDIVTSK
ncbi:hypothetical protein LINGRAHAP2_LOCUS9817 [Linum grandiflorum]